MNCPHCQKELPANYSANWCSFCGRDFFQDQTPSPQAPEINWFIFFGVLLAPAIISMLGIIIAAGGIVVFATFIGSVWAGRYCGRTLAERQARGMEANTLVTLGLSVLFAALSFILCFGGCMLPVVIQSKNH